jgi:GAF domain-containing protein/HAMP domain-containing protein
MLIFSLTQNLQYIAWFMALVFVVLGMYVLVLNPRHTANRHTLMLLLLFAVQSAAAGLLMETGLGQTAAVVAEVLSAAEIMAPPAALLTALVILRPRWMLGWQGLVTRPLYLLIHLPIIITFLDVWQKTGIWFTGLPAQYAGGFLAVSSLTQGSLAAILRSANIYLPALLLASFLLYIGLFARGEPRSRRILAWLLFAAHAASLLLMFSSSSMWQSELPLLFTNTAYLLVLGYATFSNLISPRSEQTGSLRLRLTTLILAVSVPVLVGVAALVTIQARSVLLQQEQSSIESMNRTLRSAVNIWLDFNLRALQEMASRPEISSLDPAQQQVVLERFARTYPHLYLVSAVDAQGMNTARSDGEPLVDYSDRGWFQAALRGETAYETVIGRTTGQPALVAAVPIRSPEGEVVGAAMFASDLDLFASQIGSLQTGARGQAFVVDQNNLIVAHPDPKYSGELTNFSSNPSVAAARSGRLGSLEFSDIRGEHWQAFVSELDHSWLVVVQLPTSQLLQKASPYQTTAFIGVAVGSVLLLLLASLTISQGIQPIRRLTQTALKISEGDLTHPAEIENQDEVGLLAEAFNKMTNQLRSFIADLEKRVEERTRDLEKRAVQLQVTAEVAREALAITELEELLNHAARLISRRFSFYHTGIFLLDEAREYAFLRAASSEGGKRMLERQHRLKVGQEGIVGTAAAAGSARIALDVGADAVFFNNPDLPQTRSEAALPLKVRDTVIGVLDVQSTAAWAFSPEDVDILQILADQIALGIENAQLLARSQRALHDLEALYSTQTRQAWEQRLENQALTYRYSAAGVAKAEPVVLEHLAADSASLVVPITLRNQELGRVLLRRDSSGGWLEEEKLLIQQTISQVALALENARLLDEVQRNAYEEQVIGEIAATAQSSLNLETVMKATVEELGRVLQVSRVQIRLAGRTPAGEPGADAPESSNGNGFHSEYGAK